jgi:Cu(I)/Ag(I) efflux system periplasmic protein CusF
VKKITKYLAVGLGMLSGSTHATAESLRVLDAGNHPSSAEHQEIFVGDVLPLDATLSWRNRFNGDETFNTSIGLPAHRSNSTVVMNEPATAPLNEKMDGQGIVKGIRPEQGKVKIQHGAIEKYGMPAMTMLFRVRNPNDLIALKKEMKVQFNIDNSSGGFEIIQIKPAEQ